MSNPKNATAYGITYRRQRSETPFDTLDMAVKLKHKVSVYVMNEKRVPKKWRYFNGKPAVEYARMIRDCVSIANDIYLDRDNIDKRQEFQKKALRYCNLLQLQLMDIIAECDGANEENMHQIADLLTHLIQNIKKWMKTDSGRII